MATEHRPDTQEWPELCIAHNPDRPQLGYWQAESRAHSDAYGFPSETYVPLHSIRERLGSDEIVEAAARAMTMGFGRVFEGDRQLARAALEAVAATAFPEEQQQQAEGEER